MLYVSKSGKNLLTHETLQRIKEFEQKVVGVESYKNKMCQLESRGTDCRKPISPVQFFTEVTYLYGVSKAVCFDN